MQKVDLLCVYTEEGKDDSHELPLYSRLTQQWEWT